MSRFLINDPTGQDARSLLTAEKMATISDIVTPSPQYLTATGANELTVTADTVIAISGGSVFKTPLAVLTAANLDTGASFIVGKNYYVYICDPGNGLDERYVISLNSTYPAGYSAANSRKIGGFHYGGNRRVNAALEPINTSNVAYGSGWESNVYDGIVPRSVWTLKHRPKAAPEGMVYMGSGTWVDIYIASDDGNGGIASVYNALPMTGTEGMDWYSFAIRAMKSNKRMLSEDEFIAAAHGSPQGNDANNDNAWSATTNTGRKQTGQVARAVSAIGVRDYVANVYKWLKDSTVDTTGAAYAWHDPMAGKGYGQLYMQMATAHHKLFAGGLWSHGVHAGSRTVFLHNFPWLVNSSIGVVCASDSL